MQRLVVVVLAVALSVITAGCGVSIPADPHDSLDRIRSSQVLAVGASPRVGWVEVSGMDADPTGREAALVEAFAEELGAQAEWTVSGEEDLVTMLEKGEIDLAVGGFTDKNMWVDKVGLTRPYVEEQVDGTTEKHVMMVRMGENALQSELERFLDTEGGGS